MIKFDVTNRFTGAVQFTAEIDCPKDTPRSVKLGLSVRWAIKTGANLTGANLTDANLAYANLAYANLAGAYLAYAYLADANLAYANLADANLTGANLAGANLADADLTGAKWRGDITINRAPLQFYGLAYHVTILDAHMQIGCELHTLADWAAFDNERIAKMDGLTARKFWDANRDWLLAAAKADGRWETTNDRD